VNRRRIIFALVAAAIAAAALTRLDRHSAGPDLTGQWKSWQSDFRISRQGDLYRVVVHNPAGLLGGTYTGKFRNGAIHVTGPLAPLCGEITYSAETRKLEFCGEEFERGSPEAPGAPAPGAKAD
jgi:hypothetical protein